MTNPSSSALKLLSLLLTLTAIAERGALTHIDTILLGSGAVLFLMLMEAQQRAAGESWGQAGLWLKALLGPSMLPFYALLFGALIAAPQGPAPRIAAPYAPTMPSSAYPYMSQRQPGMPGGQSVMPGSAGNPGTTPRPSPSGFGPPSAYPVAPKTGQPSTAPGQPSLQRPLQMIQRGPGNAPQISPQGSPSATPGKTSPAASSIPVSSSKAVSSTGSPAPTPSQTK